MELLFLGSGSAFVSADENYQSNILITKRNCVEQQQTGNLLMTDPPQIETKLVNVGTKRLLFDAGTTIQESLLNQELKVEDIDSIFISHNHADHNGGMEYIGFKRFFGTCPFGKNIPKLYGNVEVIKELWKHSLKAGMSSMQGQRNTLSTYFKVNKIAPNKMFNFYRTAMEPIQTVHVVDDKRIVPSYGLMIPGEVLDGKIFITGDTQFAPNQMITYYQNSILIFQDCEFADYPNSVHAQFHQLCELSSTIKEKMWLYHYMLNDKTLEELENLVLKNGFAGLVKRGQEFEI